MNELTNTTLQTNGVSQSQSTSNVQTLPQPNQPDFQQKNDPRFYIDAIILRAKLLAEVVACRTKAFPSQLEQYMAELRYYPPDGEEVETKERIVELQTLKRRVKTNVQELQNRIRILTVELKELNLRRSETKAKLPIGEMVFCIVLGCLATIYICTYLSSLVFSFFFPEAVISNSLWLLNPNVYLAAFELGFGALLLILTVPFISVILLYSIADEAKKSLFWGIVCLLLLIEQIGGFVIYERFQASQYAIGAIEFPPSFWGIVMNPSFHLTWVISAMAYLAFNLSSKKLKGLYFQFHQSGLKGYKSQIKQKGIECTQFETEIERLLAYQSQIDEEISFQNARLSGLLLPKSYVRRMCNAYFNGWLQAVSQLHNEGKLDVVNVEAHNAELEFEFQRFIEQTELKITKREAERKPFKYLLFSLALVLGSTFGIGCGTDASKPEKVPTNAVVLLDLSNRIDPRLNPEQVQIDKNVIGSVYEGFETQVKKSLFINSKDQIQTVLMPQTTNPLVFNFTDRFHIDMNRFKPNEKRFKLKDHLKSVNAYTDSLYSKALKTDRYDGADFVRAMNEMDLGFKSDARNVLFIITDGYTIAESNTMNIGNRTNYLKLDKFRSSANIEKEFVEGNFGFIPTTKDLSNVEVCLLALNPKANQGADFQIMKLYFEDFFRGAKRFEMFSNPVSKRQAEAQIQGFLRNEKAL